jgi:hypothetical protein
MPERVEDWTAPSEAGKPTGRGHVLTALGMLRLEYGIDFDRVYLVGTGSGVAAAVDIASRSTDNFAGVIGRAGDAGKTKPDNFRNLPTFFSGAGAEATAFAEAAKALGYDNVTLQPEAKEPEIWAWIQQHARNANPPEVVLAPIESNANKAYWVELPPLEAPLTARVRAIADRDTNTITVDGEGVDWVRVYLNDEIVNLEKPLRIVANGVERKDLVPRDLLFTLTAMKLGRSDPGKVYVSTLQVDLPPKKAE